MGFNESKFLQGIDDRRKHKRESDLNAVREAGDLPEVIHQAHDRLVKHIFSNPAYAVQAPEFFSVYGERAVMADMKTVLDIRKQQDGKKTPQDKKAKILSETFEGLVLVNAKQNKWFGDAALFKTSSYDDIKNKTDMYGEWFSKDEGSRVLALAVDMTFSQSQSSDKLEVIRASIDRGTMGEIRYFKDGRGDFKGTRYNVPRVVLGVGSKELAELAELWVTHRNGRLENHPIRAKLIREMYTQVTGMERYATKRGNAEVARAYRQALSVVEPLYDSIKAETQYSRDPVLLTIEQKMKSFE